MKKPILGFASLLVSFCSMTAAAATTTYQFLPDPNALRTSGGFTGQGQGSRSIEGQFRLTVDFNAGIASFDQVDATLSGEIGFFDYNEGFISTNSLDVLFHMTELVSTDVNETAIHFELRRNNPTFPGADILVVVTYINNSVHLTGGFCEAMYDGFCYHLNAVALLLSKTYYVDAVNGDDKNDGLSSETAFATIQKGIDESNNEDTVKVQPGTYTGPGNRDIDFLGKAITVCSTDPNDHNIVAATVINCNGTEENPHRGFHFHSSEDVNSILNGVTIINGYVTHDLGSAGGAIYCENGCSPKIINCIITGNEATSWPLIGGGGGGAVFGCNGEISNCLISENSAMFGGGLLACAGIIRNSIITNNKAYYLGGGLCGCDGIIHSNVISHNYAMGHGGGFAYCSAYIHHNIIAYNTVPMGIGGGLYYCNGNIENNTIYANSSLNGGGGLADCSGNVSNCVVWSNLPDQIRNVTTVQYSDVQDGYPGEGNINVNPLFVNAASGDYHLKSQAGRWDPNSQTWVTDTNTSPCIDAGNPGCPVGDEPAPNGNRINMGAYGGTAEASKSPTNWRSIADLTNDWAVDFNDLKVFVDYWLETGECIPSNLNRSQSVDFGDFAIFGQQWSTPLPEPGIIYQIGDCNLKASGLFAAEQSSQTRFTVTVEGRYIHFQDMMVANCCADKLELEMIVEDNLIVIHEIEHTTRLCLCICDYPVTATLGPFEPGTYTLEVYEDFGGFIGSTVFTIGTAQ